MSGVWRIVMKPLIDDVPVVAGMVIAMKAPPQVGSPLTLCVAAYCSCSAESSASAACSEAPAPAKPKTLEYNTQAAQKSPHTFPWRCNVRIDSCWKSGPQRTLLRAQIHFKLDVGKQVGGALVVKPIMLWLDPFLRHTLTDLFVWPNRIVVPLSPDPNFDYSILEMRCAGFCLRPAASLVGFFPFNRIGVPLSPDPNFDYSILGMRCQSHTASARERRLCL